MPDKTVVDGPAPTPTQNLFSTVAASEKTSLVVLLGHQREQTRESTGAAEM
jgi:hypothetical protein